MEKTLFAVCVREPWNELIAAECEALTGGKPDKDGIAICHSLAHIHRAAYVRAGVCCLAQGKSLEMLVDEIAHTTFDAEDFHIEFVRLSNQQTIDRQTAIVAVADAIPAYPNLNNPKHRFMLTVQDNGLWFGEIVTTADHGYEQHNDKPYRTSSSLPARLSRGLVNLVIPPARTIIDPCCGTGSILLEAQAIGAYVFGADWNQRMVGMSRKNLAHFGYAGSVVRCDARELNHTADALVTDLPYGRYLAEDASVIHGILAHGARLAPVAVYVAGRDIHTWLEEAGYHDIEVFRVQKYAGFSRYVHRARSSAF